MKTYFQRIESVFVTVSNIISRDKTHVFFHHCLYDLDDHACRRMLLRVGFSLPQGRWVLQVGVRRARGCRYCEPSARELHNFFKARVGLL
jgi:hypothetical protein